MKKIITLSIFPLFLSTVSSQEVQATDSAVNHLANKNLKITISSTGKILSIENILSSEKYRFLSDQFELDTDIGVLSNKHKKPNSVRKDRNSITYRFDYDNVHLELVYTLKPGNGFCRRSLKVITKTSLRINNLKLGEIKFSIPADETIHYMTFWMSPTVEFIRFNKGGIFTGIENPFYHADLDKNGVSLNFEPGLILKIGEEYSSESQFIGVYKRSGILIEDSARPFRFANGSGHIPIDLNESRAMRAFAIDYLSPFQDNFLNINYQFFHPLPQMPVNDNDKSYFLNTIDTFADIEGDMIIFKPLHPYKKPDSVTEYWNVLPEDKNSTARQIADYAEKRGISYGFYMGVAAHGKEGNSGGLSFRPEKKSWKKLDGEGRRAPDNCIGNDDFFKWWLQVHNNTINRYKLSNWSWDPSLGSAMNCYDENHGHIAGKGAYKGWRRCIELKGQLKKMNPGLFIQGFYGEKHFGLWGLKHTDQHEVYSEQTAIVSTLHPQMSDDRQNADGLRFQNYWSMRFRFLPTVIGHSLVHRMSEGGFDRELIKAWDFYGWQYSLMSSLAVSGSVMPAILPYESDLVPGYKEFYNKWTAWAKKTFHYVNYTEPFGEQVEPGSIDGYARIKGNHGYVFLFNGNPRPSSITFEMGDEINLKEKGNYEFVELYPSEKHTIVLDDLGNSVFSFGDKTSITLPANSCRLMELRPIIDSKKPVLLGVSGEVKLLNNQLHITGVSGKPGHTYPIRIRLSNPISVVKVTVNNIQQNYSINNNEILLDIQFTGESYVRELDHWIRTDSTLFDFPYHDMEKNLIIKTKFKINKEVINLLDKAKPKNFVEIGEKISAWQNSSEFSYSYHNFIGSRPDRLWLIIPFTFRCLGQSHFNEAIHHEHQKVKNLKVTINSNDVSELIRKDNVDHSYYVDVTDLIIYGGENKIEMSMEQLGMNEFMGPYLIYPNEELINQVLSESRGLIDHVTYSKPLISRRPPRYLKGVNGPVITEASVIGNVSLEEPTQLRVNLNLPPEQIQSVTYSHSGFPWMGKVSLSYHDELKLWVGDVKPGDRWRIQESENIYVWAVSVDGLYSEYYPVKVGWDFK